MSAIPEAVVFPVGETWYGSLAVLELVRGFVSPHLKGPPEWSECHLRDDELHILEIGDDRIAVVNAVRKLTGWPLLKAVQQLKMLPLRLATSRLRDAVWELVDAGARVDRDGDGMPPDWQPWSIQPIDGAELVGQLDGIRMREGWRLYGDAFRNSNGGHGSIWSKPPGAPEPTDWDDKATAEPLAAALELDGTAATFLRTSMLIREATEYAAYWHGVSWWAHELVDDLVDEPWEWESFDIETETGVQVRDYSACNDFRPRVVKCSDGSSVVSFFTVSRLGRVSLECHLDKYQPGVSVPLSLRLCVAYAGLGYVH